MTHYEDIRRVTAEDFEGPRNWELVERELHYHGWKRFWIMSSLITVAALLVGYGLQLIFLGPR